MGRLGRSIRNIYYTNISVHSAVYYSKQFIDVIGFAMWQRAVQSGKDSKNIDYIVVVIFKLENGKGSDNSRILRLYGLSLSGLEKCNAPRSC